MASLIIIAPVEFGACLYLAGFVTEIGWMGVPPGVPLGVLEKCILITWVPFAVLHPMWKYASLLSVPVFLVSRFLS